MSGRVIEGKRNDTLFRYLKDHAGGRVTAAKLSALAQELNDGFKPPLPDRELQAVVSSVLKYRRDGRLLVAGHQSNILKITKDELLRTSKNSDVVFLLALLKATRGEKKFTIPQKATAKTLSWGSGRVKKAIDGAIGAGWLRITLHRYRQQTRYEFGGV